MTGTILFFNGRVFPGDPSGVPSEALSVRDGCIEAIGSEEQVRATVENPDRAIDLKGKALIPSFSDSLGRLHYETMARSQVDLSKERSMTEIFSVIERFSKALPPESWIVGYGWNKGQWGWQRFPHRADLDLVSPHHPVFLFSADYRVAWLNSAAIEKLGISHDTPNPPGGEIERDEATRSATGILKETAVGIVSQNLSAPPSLRLEKSAMVIMKSYLEMGVTSVCSHDPEAGFHLMKALDDSQDLPIRVISHLPRSLAEMAFEKGWKTGVRFNRLEIGGLWCPVDGTLASQTALMLEPYADNWSNFGCEMLPDGQLGEFVGECYDRGLYPVLHASGDAAVRESLRAFVEAKAKGGNLRPTLVHGDLLSEKDSPLLSNLNLDLVANPRRIQSESRVGTLHWGKRWARALDLQTWHRSGARLRFGSGEPINHWSPLEALQAAVTSCQGDEPLSIRDGLRALCWGGGSEVGALADLVVLSRDPLQVPPDEIGGIEVIATLLEGEVVFEREGELG